MTAGVLFCMLGKSREVFMRRALKWFGVVIGGLIGLAVVLVAVLVARGSARLSTTYEVQPATVHIPTDAAAVARGEYLFSAFCAGCHRADLAGGVVIDDPGIGFVPASNLTAGQGGVGGVYSDVDFVRAIRHGVAPDGRPLVVMPSQAYWHFSDDDLGALIAYIKSAPPVDNVPGEVVVKPLGRILIAVGVLDLAANRIAHDAPRPSAPSRGVTTAYGEYLVNVADCRICHGATLSGAQPPEPGAPFAPNLTPGGELAEWRAADFITTIRTGTTPDGHSLDPRFMPWPDYAHLTDDDLTAIFRYLQSLPAVESAGEERH